MTETLIAPPRAPGEGEGPLDLAAINDIYAKAPVLHPEAPPAPEVEPTYAERLRDPMLTKEHRETAQAGTETAEDSVIADVPTSSQRIPNKLLSSQEVNALDARLTQLKSGELSDDLQLKRDWSDNAEAHAQKQAAHTEQAIGELEGKLARHGSKREALTRRRDTERHARETLADIEAGRANKAARKELFNKEMQKARFQHGEGYVGLFQDELETKAREVVDATFGKAETQGETDVAKAKRETADQKQSEYAAMLKQHDQAVLSAAAKSGEEQPPADVELITSDDEEFEQVPPAPILDEWNDVPVIRGGNLANTLGDLRTRDIKGRVSRMFGNFIRHPIVAGHISMVNAKARLGEYYSDPEKGKRRKIITGVVLGAVAVGAVAYGVMNSGGTETTTTQNIGGGVGIPEAASGGQAMAPVVEAVGNGEGVTHVIRNYATEHGMQVTPDRLAEIFTKAQEGGLVTPQNISGLTEMPNVWGGVGFAGPGNTTLSPDFLNFLNEQLGVK